MVVCCHRFGLSQNQHSVTNFCFSLVPLQPTGVIKQHQHSKGSLYVTEDVN